MSRQSKQSRNLERAKEFSSLRKSGGSGPKQTTPKHNKKKTKWNSPETLKARAAILGKFHDKQSDKTVLEKINEKKEKANQNKKKLKEELFDEESTEE